MKEDRLSLTPDLLLRAYARGIFPMAEAQDAEEIFWVDPRDRGIFPLDGFKLSRSLRRRVRAEPFRIAFDTDFTGVVAGCAARDETWINAEIASLYGQLHRIGHAHSIEVFEDDSLVGGVYGVTLGAAFFGESMFSRRKDASKIALAYLIDRLRDCGFKLFDTQFITPHLASLGALEISRAEYHRRLANALARPALFDAARPVPSPDQTIQRITQTS
ncbi:Leucyl/phenylalanyl-tRNA--protein transferase [Rhodobacteraceae bacterium THAF1]|uniref:leucyl/phenylalanyl-tRNA--protein transferase n=1 Tax=Palleronia sp. THAF1 TaxID=2587842 RepID=UPI000F3ACA99|nr:leucyl/phenylalanyl-tRNA--protein transferase [Palleronia sp. THAF1]QFU09224.1 Leucyl/phenylalanyl-tRNA--protein transferase [Palleronia sp. THAF1]VDC27350.1 Leucyl/phenylalanyl-tRNA--protein transferase [Rhodobacteraceae bacterium THAF1]